MIKKDTLPINSFTTQDGKNYRKAMKVNTQKVRLFFNGLSYEVIEITQLWRHIHGKLKKGNDIFFFKMSSTKDIGERTQNEVSWNKQLKIKIAERKVDFFDVPEIYEEGFFEDKFYYISSFHSGEFLASKYPLNTKNLHSWLEQIVKVNIFFLEINDCKCKRDENNLSFNESWAETFNRILNWYEEVKQHNLDEVLDVVKELKNTYWPALNHGDFVPWHMMQEGKKFMLIDAEHASSLSPKYYDVCYFYHRVYTSAQSPSLAKKYLKRIYESIANEDKKSFFKTLRPV